MPKKVASAVINVLRGARRSKLNNSAFLSHQTPHHYNKENYQRRQHDSGLLTRVMADAKTIVEGMPFSFVKKSMKVLMSKEFRNVTSHFKKIANSGHPLIKTTQQVMQSKTQERKIIILLMSKLISETKENPLVEDETYAKHLTLAELTELLHIAFLIQRGLINMIQTNIQDSDLQDFELGNKMSVLGGDFLLAKATMMLSQLEDSVVLGLMASAVRDMSHGFFTIPEQREHFDEHLIRNIPLDVEQWHDRNTLAHSSLISNACRAVPVLHKKDEEFGEVCADFGHHLVLAQEARSDIERITKNKPIDVSNTQFFSELCSLPSAVAAEQNGGGCDWFDNFLVTTEHDSNNRKSFSLNREKFLNTLKQDSSALAKSEEVCHYHADAALNALHSLPESESRRCLEKMTLSFT